MRGAWDEPPLHGRWWVPVEGDVVGLLWGGGLLGVLCARGEERALAGPPLPCLLVTCAFLLPL